MTTGLGAIPPPDPQRDQAQRAAIAQHRDESVLLVLLLFAQVVAAPTLGAWAGAGGGDTGSLAAGWAAVGFSLLLLGAHSLAYVLLLLLGGVTLVAALPRIFRRRQPGAEPTPPSDRSERFARGAVFAIWLGHTGLLLTGSLALLALLHLTLGTPEWSAGWRFPLTALALAALTGRLGLAMSRSGPL